MARSLHQLGIVGRRRVATVGVGAFDYLAGRNTCGVWAAHN